MAYIEVENLKYRYPGTKELALDGLNFEMEKGTFLGIVGKNGAGKSTLCQAFAGLVPSFYKGAYGGKVLVDGKVAAQTPVYELCQKVGLVFQNPFNQLSGAKETVFEEVAFGLQNAGIPKEEMIERVDRVLELLEIKEYKERNPFDLSGGQMQRVALAGILAMEPEVLVLDEPTSQLDPAGSEEVFQAIDKLAKSGITIIMVEQKIEKLAEYCDKILLMSHGKQIAFDTPEKIFSMENLEDYGVAAPVYTKLCQKFEVRLENGCYPASLRQVLAQKGELVEKIKKIQKNELKPKELQKLQERKQDDQQTQATKQQEQTQGQQLQNPTHDTIYKIEQMDFQYLQDIPILKNLNLQLDSRTTAIVGQNGAGKTTLVKLLKGLLKPVNGHIYYGGADIADKTVAMLAGEVGYVFQNPDDQIFKYRVIDEVMFGPLNIGMDSQRAKEKAREALETVGLLELEEKNPYDLELSDRKLIAIASVIAMDTKVLILDEPTIAQDRKGRKIIRSVIQNLKKQGKLVIAILHDMDFVAESFERIIVMAHGTILADGTREEVFKQKEVLKQARIEPPYLMSLCEKLGYEKPCFDLEELG